MIYSSGYYTLNNMCLFKDNSINRCDLYTYACPPGIEHAFV